MKKTETKPGLKRFTGSFACRGMVLEDEEKKNTCSSGQSALEMTPKDLGFLILLKALAGAQKQQQ